MFNNDAAWTVIELFNTFQCSIGITNIIVREFFTLQLFRCGNAGFCRIFFYIKCGGLMRVFTITHFLSFIVLTVEGARKC